MDSIFCCRGYFLSEKQKRYGTIDLQSQPDQKDSENQVKEEQAKPHDRNSEQASNTEKFIYKYFAPCVLSNVGRIVIIIVYILLIAASAYGASQVEVDFKVEYFIGKTTAIYGYF